MYSWRPGPVLLSCGFSFTLPLNVTPSGFPLKPLPVVSAAPDEPSSHNSEDSWFWCPASGCYRQKKNKTKDRFCQIQQFLHRNKKKNNLNTENIHISWFRLQQTKTITDLHLLLAQVWAAIRNSTNLNSEKKAIISYFIHCVAHLCRSKPYKSRINCNLTDSIFVY